MESNLQIISMNTAAYSVFTSPHVGTLAIPGLMFIALELLDHLSVFAFLPLLVWPPIAATSLYYSTRSLESPVWLTRHFYFLFAFVMGTAAALMYKMILEKITYTDERKVVLNI